MSHKPRKDPLKPARRRARKLGIAAASRHILLCYNQRSANCASRKEMAEAWEYLKKRLKQLGLYSAGGLLVSKCQCFDICKGGPIAVVYPDGIWYGRCRPAVLERILKEHVLGGRVVEEYVIARAGAPRASPGAAAPMAG